MLKNDDGIDYPVKRFLKPFKIKYRWHNTASHVVYLGKVPLNRPRGHFEGCDFRPLVRGVAATCPSKDTNNRGRHRYWGSGVDIIFRRCQRCYYLKKIIIKILTPLKWDGLYRKDPILPLARTVQKERHFAASFSPAARLIDQKWTSAPSQLFLPDLYLAPIRPKPVEPNPNNRLQSTKMLWADWVGEELYNWTRVVPSSFLGNS